MFLQGKGDAAILYLCFMPIVKTVKTSYMSWVKILSFILKFVVTTQIYFDIRFVYFTLGF